MNEGVQDRLYIACMNGDYEGVRSSVHAGACIVSNRLLAVRIAAYYGHLKILKYFFNKLNQF